MQHNREYDYLVVGSGLFGCVFAHEARKKGKRCLVIDKRDHLGGNIYCESIGGINVHKYGPHIFHTNDEAIWEYVQQFVTFNRFTYSPLANYLGRYYNLPFNMNTFYQMWGLAKPEEVQQKIQSQIASLEIKDARNLEEQALKLVGTDVYQQLIKGYTEKQWGRKATDLPAFIIKRLPLRFTYDNNYFNDKYQGIPIGGYNKIIEGLLKDIPCKTGVEYFQDKAYWDDIAGKVIYTGKLDEYFGYRFGKLNYRSLRFEQEQLDVPNYQGVAVVNYTDFDTPFTRIIEHKHFEYGTQSHTVVSREYPQEWHEGAEPYYPINDDRNNALAKQYKQLSETVQEKVLFGGRLAEYIYYDMHQVIASALKKARQELDRS